MIVTYWKSIPSVVRDHWRSLLVLNLAFIIPAVIVAFFEHDLLPWLRVGRPSEAYEWAGFIGRQGDFLYLPTWLCLIFWVFGTVFKRKSWKAGAVAVFLAAAIAGVNVNFFRLTLGRPRPSAQWEDIVGTQDEKGAWFLFGAPEMPEGADPGDPPPQRLYGPSSSYHLQSLPSGHSATSFGFSTAACVLAPAWAIPVTIAAGSVAWARMERNRHWPSDVLLGGSLGASWGLIIGIAGRRLIARQKEEEEERLRKAIANPSEEA
ncbi:MAG: glycerophosphatase [Puniceicoccaceae bacterium 5H]|nr:MAG: glycerophosphatase [Puniceicoccaceae bacterium 5H]